MGLIPVPGRFVVILSAVNNSHYCTRQDPPCYHIRLADSEACRRILEVVDKWEIAEEITGSMERTQPIAAGVACAADGTDADGIHRVGFKSVDIKYGVSEIVYAVAYGEFPRRLDAAPCPVDGGAVGGDGPHGGTWTRSQS